MANRVKNYFVELTFTDADSFPIVAPDGSRRLSLVNMSGVNRLDVVVRQKAKNLPTKPSIKTHTFQVPGNGSYEGLFDDILDVDISGTSPDFNGQLEVER